MEQGRLAEAADAYQKMIDIKPFYQSYTRAAHLRWLKGDLEGAIDLIHKAIQAASPRDRESVAWGYTRLAPTSCSADASSGRARHRGSAEYQPEYAPALLTKGRVLLALSRPVDAVAMLRRARPPIRCPSTSGSWLTRCGSRRTSAKRSRSNTI